jgi:mono/diheme cytochrome c family protein
MPTQAPVRFAAAARGPIVLAAATAEEPATPPAQVAMARPAPVDLAEIGPEAVEGRSIFNSTCAHCHGPNAEQAVARINLRLLKRRYGEKMDEIFIYTVTHGRPSKGMPNWSGILSDDDFTKIRAFLHTVQQGE